MSSIISLNKKISNCKKCPRLAVYIRDVAKNKVRRFKNEKYYGKPLSGFGDINAKLLIIGLAPAAHGGNRTGRMFTGDSSGDWLAKVMHKHGFASIPTSQSRDDGLTLRNAYITAAVRCAPPQNKPTKDEMNTCFQYLEKEKGILTKVTTILCLGKIGYEAACELFDVLPDNFVYPIEGRYESWFSEKAIAFLKQNNHCLVWNDVEGVTNSMPIASNYLYIRLIGNRKISDSEFGKISIDRKEQIKKWTEKLKKFQMFHLQ